MAAEQFLIGFPDASRNQEADPGQCGRHRQKAQSQSPVHVGCINDNENEGEQRGEDFVEKGLQQLLDVAPQSVEPLHPFSAALFLEVEKGHAETAPDAVGKNACAHQLTNTFHGDGLFAFRDPGERDAGHDGAQPDGGSRQKIGPFGGSRKVRIPIQNVLHDQRIEQETGLGDGRHHEGVHDRFGIQPEVMTQDFHGITNRRVIGVVSGWRRSA